MAQSDHNAGGDHIQDQLLGSASLHTGGAGDHLRSGIRVNGDIRKPGDGAARVGGDADSKRAMVFGVLQGCQHISGAAGGAAYVLAALQYAKDHGALTVGITSNAGSPISRFADIAIDPDTGAEVVTGSTRMKAGTAQKLILNMISTGVMIRLGHVYENMMINLRPTNIKLTARMVRIVQEITGLEEDAAKKLLEENDWSIRKAVEK